MPCEIASGRRHARTTAEARLASAACSTRRPATADGWRAEDRRLRADKHRGVLRSTGRPVTMDHATAAAVMGLPEGSGAGCSPGRWPR